MFEFLFLLLLIFGLVSFIFFIVALVDILKSEFRGYNKIVWLLLVILLPTIGVIAYFIIGRKQKIKTEM